MMSQPHKLSEFDFIAIPVEVVANETLKVPFPLYVRISDRFILLREVDDSISSNRAESLYQKQVSAVFVPKNSWLSVLRFYEERQKVLEQHPWTDDSLLNLRNLILLHWEDVLDKRELILSDIEQFKNLSEMFVNKLLKQPFLGPKLIRRYNNSALYVPNHSVNSAIYSALIGSSLKMSKNQIQTLFFSTLFQNIGYLRLRYEKFLKPELLTQQEQKLMSTHPLKGSDILTKLNVPKECIDTCFTHHERPDGTGYPLGLRENDIPLYSKICALVDVFDALQSYHAHQGEHSYLDSVAKVRGMHKLYDSKLFEHLFKLGF